ncbi:SUPPRESSOR OF npr1-1 CONSTITUTIVE 1 protein [Nymphaea thermarum]|nr:SUPPRESSOR OF npr1-1 CONSTITUTIVE 1 protein [Nymphaea thermarum]
MLIEDIVRKIVRVGTEKIEAIQLNSGTYWPPMYVEAESFVAMSQLRMLRLGAVVHLKGEFEHFPKKLRWLEWHPQDLDSLPGSLHLENIVVLDLSHSRITQLWNPQGLESTKVFGKMKVLNLAGCYLTSCPDFNRMTNLQKLNFAECREMSELDPSIGHLKSLTHLSLNGCWSLKTLPQEIWQLTSLEELDTLPQKIWQLTSLEELDLTHCLEITTLPTQMEDPKSLKLVLLGKLKVLKFFGCWNLTIRPDFTSMPYLEKLDFTYCKKMSELDPSIGLLESLTHLELRECRSLKTLPQEIWQLTSLEELDLSFCTEITTLPSQLEDPKSLKPVLLGKLKVLNFNYCSNLTISPQFTSMPHLQKLNFLGCSKMSELDPSIGLLESLTHFSLSFCRSLKTLPQEIWQLTSLYKLDLSYCTEITALPSQLEDPQSLKQVLLGKLKVLSFSYCSNLTICPDFTSMPHLEVLDFRNCTKMSELDPSIGLLKRLTHLYLEGCESLKELPQEVSQLTSLITLNLNGCYQISALPKSMSCLKQLERLRPCSSLTEIPDCICSFVLLDNLKQLSVSHCCRLKLLPWFLPSLNTLEARCCGKLEDVPGINQMILLWRLDLGGCRSLHDSFFKRLQVNILENLCYVF